MSDLHAPNQTVEWAIRKRVTTKVLAEHALPTKDLRGLVQQLLSISGMAPFHRPCDPSHRDVSDLPGIEPWRFYALDAEECRKLRERVPAENAGKIPAMLNAADALILATWLPNPIPDTLTTRDERLFDPTLANMEHIAAASAAIQNLLLLATEQGMDTYWSSGGVLRSNEVMERLGIAAQEILLGAIFLFPQDSLGAPRVASKLRGQRTAAESWSRWVSAE